MNELDIKNDVIFKHIFGGETKESKLILQCFLKTFLDLDVYEIEPMNPGASTGRNEKQIIGDVLIKVNGCDFINIEMQKNFKKDNNERFVSCESLLYMHRVSRGQSYDYGKNIVLVFSGYKVRKDGGPSDDLICYRYYDGYTYSNKYIIRIVELVGLKHLTKKPIEKMTRIERYKVFMYCIGKKKYVELIKKLITYEEGLKMTLFEMIKNSSETDYTNLVNQWWCELRLEEERRWEEKKKLEKEEWKRERKIEREARRVEREKWKKEIELEKEKSKKEIGLEKEKSKKEIESEKENLKKEIESKKENLKKEGELIEQEKFLLTKTMELLKQGIPVEEASKKAEELLKQKMM